MALMIDIFIAMLLIAAIGYGMVLNRRIVALRRDQADLERLAVSFHEATTRAESSVGNLKKAAQQSSQILKDGIDQATRIRDDLNFLIDRGEALGNQLESSVRNAEKSNSPHLNNGGKKQLPRNPVEPANEFLPAETEPDLPVRKIAGAMTNANVSDNQLEKSEAERELIKALQAVR
ncbi:MAG: hypothetical protein HN731_01260 [Rhodospirillaceae bacterium]|nr:hypothetical protein [Rhodospirillaceae bacterium]